jgi:hypothetical protein
MHGKYITTGNQIYFVFCNCQYVVGRTTRAAGGLKAFSTRCDNNPLIWALKGHAKKVLNLLSAPACLRLPQQAPRINSDRNRIV